ELAGEELDPTLARTNLLGSIGDLLGPLTLALAAGVGLGWRPVFAGGGVLMLAYARRLPAPPLPRPQPDGSTPWSVARAGLGAVRGLRLAVFWPRRAALDEPFLGFLIAHLEKTHHVSRAAATGLVVSVVAGATATYAALAVVPRTSWGRSRLAVGATGLL